MRVPHPDTGVPLLDRDYAPGGGVNAHSLEKVLIAESFYKKDAMYLLENAPAAYWGSVLAALTRWYFMSPMAYDDSLPSHNRECIGPVVHKTNALFLPDEEGIERLLVVTLPLTLLYALYRVLGARGTLESERAIVGSILFMLPLIAYVTLSTALVAVGDFSRYRYNVDPFYVILFALLATDAVERGKGLWRSARLRFRWGRPSRAAMRGT
jgi:hypothetical protein